MLKHRIRKLELSQNKKNIVIVYYGSEEILQSALVKYGNDTPLIILPTKSLEQ